MNEVTTAKIIEMGRLDHAIALEKGWWKVKPNGSADFSQRDIRELFFLAISELVEAGEVWRDNEPITRVWYRDSSNKPEGFPIELADFVIRLGETLTASGHTGLLDMTLSEFEVNNDGSPMTMLYDLVLSISGYARKNIGDKDINMFLSDCADAISGAFQVATNLGFDLWEAIEIKRAYNKTREFRHGGKAA